MNGPGLDDDNENIIDPLNPYEDYELPSGPMEIDCIEPPPPSPIE
jgi:hypothetical protein